MLQYCAQYGSVYQAIFVLREHQDLLMANNIHQVDLIANVLQKLIL